MKFIEYKWIIFFRFILLFSEQIYLPCCQYFVFDLVLLFITLILISYMENNKILLFCDPLFLLISRQSFYAQYFITWNYLYLKKNNNLYLLAGIFISQVFHGIAYSEPYCFLIILISLYYLGLENKYPNDWKQLCDFLPQGLAIQTDNTKSWIYCNSSLCALLNVEQSSSAYDKMEKIKNKL